jgi:chromosome segregation ATPase
MFPSFKTMVCFAVVIALAAGVLFGRDAIPYAKTAVKQARQSVQDAVPTEFDLDRASMELGESDSELLEFRKRVAELEVDLEDQKGRLEETERDTSRLRGEVEGLSRVYETSGRGSIMSVVWNGREVASTEIASQLNTCIQRIEHLGDRRDLLGRVIDEREITLTNAKQALTNGSNRREELALVLESCRFELECDKFLGTDAEFGEASSSLQAAEVILASAARDSRVRQKVRSSVGSRTDFASSGVLQGDALIDRARALLGAEEPNSSIQGELTTRW